MFSIRNHPHILVVHKPQSAEQLGGSSPDHTDVFWAVSIRLLGLAWAMLTSGLIWFSVFVTAVGPSISPRVFRYEVMTVI